MGRSWIILAALLVAIVLSAAVETVAEEAALAMAMTPLRRRPAAAVLIDHEQKLCVVNRRSGSVSLINLKTRQLVREQQIGQRLSDVALLDERTLLIADEETHELLVVRHADDALTTVRRLAVARHPCDVTVSSDGSWIAVAGLWSRRVTLFSVATVLSGAESAAESDILDLRFQITKTATVRLPFSPRLQLFIDDGRRLVVADAFGGKMAVIDPPSAEVVSIRDLPAQNIRGITLSADGDQLLLAHQILNPLARADRDDMHWGNLLQNVIREVSVEAVLDPMADLTAGSRVVPLGGVDAGAADPGGIVRLPEHNGWITCLSGTNEVSIRTKSGSGRVQVDALPTSIVWDERRLVAYVLCTLDDTIAVVDPIRQTVVDRLSLGPQPEATPADRGERLFVDGLRSHDGWVSCQSCHPGGHTTGGLADTKSDETYGTPKRILSLLGTRDNNPWAWNGRFRELHEQVDSSFTSTLHGDRLPMPKISDVVAYLHTLTPPPPVDDGEWSVEDLARIERGRELFNALGCHECHVPSQTYTIDQTFDVGLSDEAGLKKYNPPSLRGLGQRDRFFHDGRAESLEAVFGDHVHQLEAPLNPDDLQKLAAFLRSL